MVGRWLGRIGEGLRWPRKSCSAAVVASMAIVVWGGAGCRQAWEPTRDYSAEPPAEPRRDYIIQPDASVAFQRLPYPALEEAAFSNGREAGAFTILEIVGGGVACADFDRDGWCDLWFACGGHIDRADQRVTGIPCRLLRNLGEDPPGDITRAARVGSNDLYAHGVSTADVDNDGFADALVYGYHGVQLWRNNGDGTFIDITHWAGLGDAPWTTGVAWFDFDRDGWLDLHGITYVDWSFDNHPTCLGWYREPDVCPPVKFNGTPDWTMRGTPEGRFQPRSDWFRPDVPGRGLGVLAYRVGIDDLWPRLLVANDMMENALYVPDRRGGYAEQAMVVGVAVDHLGNPNASMGVGALDANLDQCTDLFINNFDHELMGLYQCIGPDIYDHASLQYGLSQEPTRLVAFGTVQPDLDCDGDEDIVVVGGAVQYRPDYGGIEQRPVVLLNQAGERFVYALDTSWSRELYAGRGLACLDWNNDGSPDLVATDLLGAPRLFVNRSPHAGGWIQLNLVGTASPRIPLGAVVRIAPR